MQNNDSKENKFQPLLSVGQASEYLGISVDTLRRWEKKEKVEAYRSPGNHRYFKKQDLDKLFGRKYERAAETKPRITKEKTLSKQPEVVTEQEQVIEQKLTEFILDRPIREVKIPPAVPIRIIKEEHFSFTKLETKTEGIKPTQKQTIQQLESILTPSTINETATIPEKVLLKPESEKSKKLTTKTKLVLLTTAALVILAVVFILIMFSPPKILSPVP